MQRDGTVFNMVLRIFLRVIAQSLFASCPDVASVDKATPHIGAVAFIQRFGLKAWYIYLPGVWVSTTSFAAIGTLCITPCDLWSAELERSAALFFLPIAVLLARKNALHPIPSRLPQPRQSYAEGPQQSSFY